MRSSPGGCDRTSPWRQRLWKASDDLGTNRKIDAAGVNDESWRGMVRLPMRKRIARTGAKTDGKSAFPWKTYATIAVMIVLVLWAVEHPGNFLSQLIRVIFAP
jgi:hypothetical protein